MISPEDAQAVVRGMRLEPFSAFGSANWFGSINAIGECSTDEPEISDVVEVVSHCETGDRFEGNSYAVVRLLDGRFLAWETWWGATGDGFFHDAYGGDSDVVVSMSLALICRLGISDEARSALDLGVDGTPRSGT